MSTTAEQLRKPRRTLRPSDSGASVLRSQRRRGASVLMPWLRGQAINVTRHAAALRPFRRDEFGTGGAAPSEGHIQAVNSLMNDLRRNLLAKANKVTQAVGAARADSNTQNLQAVVTYKERAHNWVRAVEQIWDFYFELFGQRQSRFADMLLSCDRIALDCYQVAFMGVGLPKSIPAPPPFSYMRTGFSPATYRRGIPLRRLGRNLNPFPLIQLPYHRLVNPWTLGAILHEVSHNTQNDMGLAEIIPRQIGERLLRAGLPRSVATVWVRWNRETFADLSGLLLGGPAVVASLMDVIGRGPRTVKTYSPRGPHPTPYVRAFISFELLRRMGFQERAEQARRAWMRCYPNPRRGTIPREVLDTMERAIPLVVETICYRPYATLGNKCLAEVIRFGPREQLLVEEAARRLAAGTDPGIIPERFLIGASRFAFDTQMARPEVIKENFYKELSRR
ncbi:MAG TPA: hypothetical protein VD861_03170 [Pyrinomonadaceae bacterium]|nr:hypothetical protein [Pyrinomonadaceae bacterium]